MSRFFSVRGWAIVTAVLCLASVPGAGQPSSAATAPWVHPRTSWGDPDLQAIWTNFSLAFNSVDIEAPGSTPRVLGGTGVGNPCLPGGSSTVRQERPGPVRPAQQQRADRTEEPSPFFGVPSPFVATSRVSGSEHPIVVEPADGKLPPLAPWAEDRLKAACEHVSDTWEYLTPWVRCISRGVPGVMFPSQYNNAYQVVQIPGYVTIFSEMIHDLRIIPVDGRPRGSQKIRRWMGESRGHWEGNTLVVETTNFHDRGEIRGRPHSDALHVVERFKRVSADTLEYEATVDDPKAWTAPWKAALPPLVRDDNYRMYEYACSEGNYSLDAIMRSNRLKH